MYLGGALFVLVLGTLAVLLLISRRRPVDGLTFGLDALMRTITMNRLLRTVATVASGLAAIAGNHAARTDPAAGPADWFNPAGALNLGVLLLILLWSPPRLTGRTAKARARRQPGRTGHAVVGVDRRRDGTCGVCSCTRGNLGPGRGYRASRAIRGRVCRCCPGRCFTRRTAGAPELRDYGRASALAPPTGFTRPDLHAGCGCNCSHGCRLPCCVAAG